MVGESISDLDGSGAAPNVGMPLFGQLSPDLSNVPEAVVGEEAKKRVEDKGTEADDESESFSVGGCEYEVVTVKEAVGRTGLISEIETAYDTYFVGHQYELDPYWKEDLFDQDKLEYKGTYNKPNDQIESDDLITDAKADALRYALIDLWTVNPLLPD